MERANRKTNTFCPGAKSEQQHHGIGTGGKLVEQFH